MTDHLSEIPGLALHHVALVVADLTAASERQKQLGFPAGDRFTVADQGVEVVTFAVGPGYLELISPTNPDGAIAKFMAKRGEGFHHVAYRVDDLPSALTFLQANGVRLIDSTPRTGAHGWQVAFVHPESCGGVLTELVQVL